MKIGTVIGIIATVPLIIAAEYFAWAVFGLLGLVVLNAVFAYTVYQEVVNGRFIWSEKDSVTVIKDGKLKTYEEK